MKRVPVARIGCVIRHCGDPSTPLTRLVDGIMGTANRVSLSRVCAERGWECRVSQDEAMTRIKAWGKTGYQA